MSQSVAERVADFTQKHPGGTIEMSFKLGAGPSGVAILTLTPPEPRPHLWYKLSAHNHMRL